MSCGGARKITRRDLESSAPTTTGRNAPQSNQPYNFVDLTDDDDDITSFCQRSGGPTPPPPCLVKESVAKSTGRSDQPTPPPPCLVKETSKTSKSTRKRSAANRLEQFNQIFNPAHLSSRPCTTSTLPPLRPLRKIAPPRPLRKIAPKPPTTSSTPSISFNPNHAIPATSNTSNFTLNLPFFHYVPLNQTYYIPLNQSFLPVAPPPLNQSFLPVAPPPLVTPSAPPSIVTTQSLVTPQAQIQSSSPLQSPSVSPIIIAPLSPLQPHNLLPNSPSSS